MKGSVADWETFWGKRLNPPIIVAFLTKGKYDDIAVEMALETLPRHESILDVGCGTGRTLERFRRAGYRNSIGIDVSPESIRICEENGFKAGRDVYLADVTKSPFPKESFTLVYAEGLLEHFDCFEPLVRGMCHLSQRFVLIVQPNHFSIYGRLLKMGQDWLGRGVEEISYKLEEFVKCFEKYDFPLAERRFTPLHDHAIMLFEK